MPRIINQRKAEFVPEHGRAMTAALPRRLLIATVAAPARRRTLIALRDHLGEIGAR